MILHESRTEAERRQQAVERAIANAGRSNPYQARLVPSTVSGAAEAALEALADGGWLASLRPDAGCVCDGGRAPEPDCDIHGTPSAAYDLGYQVALGYVRPGSGLDGVDKELLDAALTRAIDALSPERRENLRRLLAPATPQPLKERHEGEKTR